MPPSWPKPPMAPTPSAPCKRGCAEAFGYNGNMMVGKAYTAQLRLQPGDEFEIKLGRKQIQLIPLGAAEEE